MKYGIQRVLLLFAASLVRTRPCTGHRPPGYDAGRFDPGPGIGTLRRSARRRAGETRLVRPAPGLVCRRASGCSHRRPADLAGGVVGRVFKFGKQPVNAKLAAYYSVWKPDNASDWNVQFLWTFLFPK
jgi:hypothetical protein